MVSEEEMVEQVLTQEEYQDLQRMVSQQVPTPDEKFGLYQFFANVLKKRDSTKVSNLVPEELESVRILLRGATYFNIKGADLITSWLAAKAEIINASALSKKGFFVQAAVTSRKDVHLGTRRRPKRRLFGGGGGQEQQENE